MASIDPAAVKPEERLVSLDIFRGLTMIVLISHGFGLHHLEGVEGWGWLATQLTHHPWNGLRAWDLIQPFFMFIVGVAMPFSITKREQRGQSRRRMFAHVVKRCLVLAFIGVVVLRGGTLMRGEPSLTNVLAQIAVTYFVTYLFIRKPLHVQLLITLGILLVYDLAFRFIPLPYDAVWWTKHENLGAFIDHWLGCRKSDGGWVSINAVSTTAHTMWGAMAGWVLMSRRSGLKKIGMLLAGGVAALAAGFALDPVTPIIKRIATSSFVLASGGICLVALALLYAIVDVLGFKKWGWFATVVGMNCIFIYTFNGLLGGWLKGFVGTYAKPLLGSYELACALVIVNVALLAKWYLCYWLYRHRAFIKA